MKRVLNFIGIAVLSLVGIIFLIVLVSYINHQIQLSREEKQFNPTGQMVEVNGNEMHVYIEGEGSETLVFMSGGGTSSPVLDFKSLYSLLSDQYQIVVIEKAGYGFSEITEASRDIETILSETRGALEKAEVDSPYVLFPHSMSGIEALFWAQTYPEEVKAIVGLDMAVPMAYENMEINIPLLRLGEFAANVGLIRWMPNLIDPDSVEYSTLTESEVELFELIAYRRTSTTNMVEEVIQVQENAQKINIESIADIPMLLFTSNGQGTGWDKETWIQFQEEFIKNQENAGLIELDGSHYIHNIEFDRIAEEAKEFMEEF